jgi:deoxyribodipyrimidine photo-lyase
MAQKFKRSLFIFRRDLRLTDNTGLLAALESSAEVLPCFIFNPEQVSNHNRYKSPRAVQFMLESLDDLDHQLKAKGGQLYAFEGNPAEVVEELIKKHMVDAVFVNTDYTPYSIARDAGMKEVCEKNNVPFVSHHDLLLVTPEQGLKADKRPYVMFTPFWRHAAAIPVATPCANNAKHYTSGSLQGATTVAAAATSILPQRFSDNAITGGRSNAKKILARLGDLKNYAEERDTPALDDKTSHLSAHLKFGTVSVREAYHAAKEALGAAHPLLRQLYWRDFFTLIAYHFPHVFGKPFNEVYSDLKWDNDVKRFKTWCNGTTGFPIVDAGMRQLVQTGYMHNRVRMLVASFLVKDLHIDWRWGEQFFAINLIDYDPALNNGNWQWTASTGCDAQPDFRIFNPWLQQKAHDPECLYIKKWLPELKNLAPEQIHKWDRSSMRALKPYPKPIVDHHKASKHALVMYGEKRPRKR